LCFKGEKFYFQYSGKKREGMSSSYKESGLTPQVEETILSRRTAHLGYSKEGSSTGLEEFLHWEKEKRARCYYLKALSSL